MSIPRNKARVLLLGAEPGGDISSAIKRFLEPQFDVDTQAHLRTVSNDQIDLAFVVFSSTTCSKDVRAQISLLKSSGRPAPIIIVAEEIPADDILDLLMNGAADFVTSPISRDNILPRALRLVQQNERMNNAD